MNRDVMNLIEAALSISGYADHDNDCGSHIGERCDCGYSDSARQLRDLIDEIDRRANSPTISTTREDTGEAA